MYFEAKVVEVTKESILICLWTDMIESLYLNFQHSEADTARNRRYFNASNSLNNVVTLYCWCAVNAKKHWSALFTLLVAMKYSIFSGVILSLELRLSCSRSLIISNIKYHKNMLKTVNSAAFIVSHRILIIQIWMMKIHKTIYFTKTVQKFLIFY